MKVIVHVAALLSLVKCVHSIRCLSGDPLNRTLNETDPQFSPNDWLEQISLDMNRTMEKDGFCDFVIYLYYQPSRIEVWKSNVDGMSAEEDIWTWFTADRTLSGGSTSFTGACSTDACDYRRVLAAAQLLLVHHKSFRSIQDRIIDLIEHVEGQSIPVQCTYLTTDGSSGVGNSYTVERKDNISDTKCTPYDTTASVLLRTSVRTEESEKVIKHELVYYCKIDQCFRDEVGDALFDLMWIQLGAIALPEADNQVAVSPTDSSSSFKSTAEINATSVITNTPAPSSTTTTSNDASISAFLTFEAILLSFLFLGTEFTLTHAL